MTCGAIGTARASRCISTISAAVHTLLARHALGAGRAIHDRDQVLLGRERDHDLEQEPVELRLGEGIGAFHLERVLGREDEERRIELVALAGDRDLVLLHRLEQARLGLRRRPVDLVGEDEVGEDRARLEPEDPLAALLDEDVRAGDVGRHQVGRELDPVERAVDDVGDGPHEHRLAEAGNALEQHVAVGEQAGQRLSDELALADDHATDLALDRLRAFGERLGREAWRLVGRDGRFHMASGSGHRGRSMPSVRRVERAEVLADVVLDRERDIAAIE